jgi:hypothetical protein
MDDRYHHEIKLEPNWDSIRGLVIFTFFNFAALVYFLYGLMRFSSNGEYLLPVIVFSILGVVMLNIILWNVNGKEIIELHSEQIIIKKTGKIFNSINTIELYELESILIDASVNPEGKLYRLNDGKIVFKYLGMEKKVGPSLSLKDAEVIVNDLNNLLALRGSSNEYTA